MTLDRCSWITRRHKHAAPASTAPSPRGRRRRHRDDGARLGARAPEARRADATERPYFTNAHRASDGPAHLDGVGARLLLEARGPGRQEALGAVSC